MITVVTTHVTACVNGCNRRTTAKPVHMHKEKSQNTTPKTLVGHPLTASSAAE